MWFQASCTSWTAPTAKMVVPSWETVLLMRQRTSERPSATSKYSMVVLLITETEAEEEEEKKEFIRTSTE